MAELRQNMVTKEWVIISTERANRPDAYKEAKNRTFTDELPERDPDCPFCPGNEELDLETERISRSGEWQVRSVYNKYPALVKDEKLVRSFNGVQRLMTGVGHHEILIEHPKHNTCPALMTPAENAAVIELFYNRGWAIHKDARIEQIIYFENHGRRVLHPYVINVKLNM